MTWVTPLVGVWIEISVEDAEKYAEQVTPLVGVWIEICIAVPEFSHSVVTPLVGVWIEMGHIRYPHTYNESLPSWECGLKLRQYKNKVDDPYVTPLVGVWIEILIRKSTDWLASSSLPSWECGLK